MEICTCDSTIVSPGGFHAPTSHWSVTQEYWRRILESLPKTERKYALIVAIDYFLGKIKKFLPITTFRVLSCFLSDAKLRKLCIIINNNNSCINKYNSKLFSKKLETED